MALNGTQLLQFSGMQKQGSTTPSAPQSFSGAQLIQFANTPVQPQNNAPQAPAPQPAKPNNIWQDVSSFFSSTWKAAGDVANKILDSKSSGTPQWEKDLYNSPLLSWNKSQMAEDIRHGTNPNPTLREDVKNIVENTDPTLGMIGKAPAAVPTVGKVIKSGLAGLGIGSATQLAVGQSPEEVTKSAPMNFLFGAAFAEGGEHPTPKHQATGTVKIFDFLKGIKQEDHPIDTNFSKAIADRYGLPNSLDVVPANVMDKVFKDDPVFLHDFLKTTDTPLYDWNKAWALDSAVPIKTETLGPLVDKPYWDKLKTQFNPGQQIEQPAKLSLDGTQETGPKGQASQVQIPQNAEGKGNQIQTGRTTQVSENPQAPSPLKPIGEGITKTSKLASGVEEKAVEKKLTDSLGNLPEYKQVSMKEQAKKATDLLSQNEQEAIDIALGKKTPPADLLPESVFTAVENKALNDGNVELIRQLAQSTRTTEATAMGQRIRALAERDPESAVGAIKQLQDARAKAVEAKTGKSVNEAVKSTVQEIKSKVKAPAKSDWQSFIESIKC